MELTLKETARLVEAAGGSAEIPAQDLSASGAGSLVLNVSSDIDAAAQRHRPDGSGRRHRVGT